MIIVTEKDVRKCSDSKLLARYAMTKNLDIKIAVAKNSSTPTSTLNDLANEPNGELQLAVAKNRNTGKAGLRYLGVNYGDRKIAAAVANNSNTSADILDDMFDIWKDCPEIVKAIKTHPNVSESTAVLCTFCEMF